MKRLSIWIATSVVVPLLGVGMGLLGYKPHEGPDVVVCVDSRNPDPFAASDGFARRSDLPVRSGMTVRSAVSQAGFRPIEFERCTVSIGRQATWSFDYVEMRCLRFMQYVVRRIPVESVR